MKRARRLSRLVFARKLRGGRVRRFASSERLFAATFLATEELKWLND